MDDKLVSSGVTQVAIGAASGWGLAALVAMPELRERLGVQDVVRLRQAHLDVLIMGGGDGLAVRYVRPSPVVSEQSP